MCFIIGMKKILNISKLVLQLSMLFYLLFSFSSCSREVSVTPPDTVPPTGSIFLDSNPKGFQIYLNNKEKGRITPDSLTWLGTGAYNITLKKDLFRDTTFIVNVVEGKRKSVYIDFTGNSQMLANITCLSKPAGAEIFIDDSNSGFVTPYTFHNILPGSHYVRYHLSNHRDDSVLVSVSSSQSYSVYKFLVDTTLWGEYTTSNTNLPSGNLTCVTVDKNNIVYAGTSDYGFFGFDGKNWKNYYTSFGFQINCCTVDNNNVVLYGTLRGFVAYDGTKQTEYGFMSSGLTDFRIQTITVDKNSNWFIGTQGGLDEVYQPTGAFTWKSYFDQDLATKYITSSAVDNNNNVWAAMLNDGVAKISTSNTVEYYTILNSKLQSNNVTAIAAGSSGEVWIGYGLDNNFGHGLTCISGSTWSNYNSTIPSYSKVVAIFIDSKNVKWVATNQGLVMFTSPSSYTLFNYDNTGLNINGVTGIAEDSYGNIWISTNTGLYEYKGSH
jgi:ligand-binding sensor domain-containing protein